MQSRVQKDLEKFEVEASLMPVGGGGLTMDEPAIGTRGPVGNSINPHTQKRKAVLRAIIPRTIDLYKSVKSKYEYASAAI